MDQFFADVSWKGLEERLEILLDKDDPEYAEKRKPYEERMDFELDIITQMGFPVTF